VSSRVAGESPSLGSNSLEDVVDERVHDAHGGLGDSSLGVHLSQDLVDVGGVRLGPLALPHLLGLVSTFLRSFGRRLGSLRCRGLSSFRSHLDQQAICSMMTVAVKSESFQLTLATATHFWSAWSWHPSGVQRLIILEKLKWLELSKLLESPQEERLLENNLPLRRHASLLQQSEESRSLIVTDLARLRSEKSESSKSRQSS